MWLDYGGYRIGVNKNLTKFSDGYMGKEKSNPVMTWLIDGATIKIEENRGQYFASGNDEVYRGCIWSHTLDSLYEKVKDAIKILKENQPNNIDHGPAGPQNGQKDNV